MAPISSILFFLSGVVLTPILESVKCVIPNYDGLDYSSKYKLHDLCTDLSMGKIGPEDFLTIIAEYQGESPDAEVQVREILEQINIDQKVLDVIAEAEKQYQLVYICDYPSGWSNSLMERFSSKPAIIQNAIFTDQMALNDMQSDLLNKTLQITGLSSELCLWVDAYEKRTMQAVANRLHAVIFVDASRLRREFVLRGMFPLEMNE